MNWGAAVWSGVAAGVVATLVEMALWAALTDALPSIFFRDARFTAAIVMGRSVLPPPATFDGPVMAVAMLVHFALSIAYGLVLAPLITRLSPVRSMLAGATFGLCVYGANLYGFITVFPWFDAARDWITAAAHLVFGIAAAGVYRVLSRRRPASRTRGPQPG